MPRVLVLNTGSSSVKYQLVDTDTGASVASGLAERIGEGVEGAVKHTVVDPESGESQSFSTTPVLADHEEALASILSAFEEHGPQLADAGLVAVGHRVVQGGAIFSEPTLVDGSVLAGIEELIPLAPLHNPGALAGLRAGMRTFPDLPHVAVFDTAFGATLPDYAYAYAVPKEWAQKYGVRRYGFHGTSHAYVSREAAAMLGKDPSEVNVIVCHLGNGASMTAVRGGKCVDTSMGMTPLQGLVMGTRTGDIDPAVVAHMHRSAGLSPNEIDTVMNKNSGLLGMTGVGDMREVAAREAAGDDDARLARDVYLYRIKHYVGAFYAALGRVDAIAFTAGVGENDAATRARSLAGLEELGIEVDPARNEEGSGARVISTVGSRVAVMVIPTNEELEIANQAVSVIAGG